MNYAVDKDAFSTVVKGGYSNYLNSSISPLLPFYAEQEPYTYDIEKAKALMAEAGYADGFSVTLWGNTESETLRGMEFLAQQLAEINITVDVVPMEEGTLSDAVYNTTPETTELQMWYVSWSAVDPDNALRSTFMSTMFPPTGANTHYYVNEEVDAGINAGNTATTFEEQFANYKAAQDRIWEDAVWIFMGVDRTVMAKNARLTGAQLSPAGSFLDIRKIGVQ
jgi:glutathione transport system substrate-binding protein